MTLTFTDGNVTTDGTEQTLFDTTADALFATWLFTHNMASGDSITVKIYVYDNNATTLRLYETVALTDAQSDPAMFIPFIPTNEYKVSIQRTAGADRNYTWQRIQA